MSEVPEAAYTDAENHLLERLEELRPFFDDMLFERGSCSYRYTKVEVVSGDENFKCQEEIPEEIDNFDYEDYTLNVEKPSDCAAYFDPVNMTLCVPTDLIDDDEVLLHEMIHLHEHVINAHPYIRDISFWSLYQALRKRIHGLDDAIEYHAHIFNQNRIGEIGGDHDVLFFLKSLDLDLRKGYPLGTVFGYGEHLGGGYTELLSNLTIVSGAE